MASTTIATMAMLNARCMTIIKPNFTSTACTKQTVKPISLLSIQNLPKSLNMNVPSTLTTSAIAGAIFSTLSTCDAAFAAQQIAEIAEGDNRGLALLLPIVPAILWVLFNILQPALNQLNRMRNSNGVIVGLGLGIGSGLFLSTPDASANEIATVAAEAAANDNRGLLLLSVVAPAILWVLFNILKPALNQINKMTDK